MLWFSKEEYLTCRPGDMVRNRPWRLLPLLAIFMLAGCASSEDVGRLQYDLINLRSEIKEIKTAGDKGGLSDKRLKDLEEEQKATSKVVSDLFMKTQELTTELQVLIGRFEEARYLAERGSREMEIQKETFTAQLQELEATVAELERRLAARGVLLSPGERKEKETGTPGEEKKTPQREEEDSLTDVKNVYMDAYSTFRGEKYGESREKFENLLKNFPENEYSDNARFWIGESYYQEKNYEDAILAYEELLKTNPASEKVPGAMLKQGLSFYELKDPETGEIILEKLIEDYPDSEQAKIAKKKLKSPAPAKKR